jgi:hypothetical protein
MDMDIRVGEEMKEKKETFESQDRYNVEQNMVFPAPHQK